MRTCWIFESVSRFESRLGIFLVPSNALHDAGKGRTHSSSLDNRKPALALFAKKVLSLSLDRLVIALALVILAQQIYILKLILVLRNDASMTALLVFALSICLAIARAHTLLGTFEEPSKAYSLLLSSLAFDDFISIIVLSFASSSF